MKRLPSTIVGVENEIGAGEAWPVTATSLDISGDGERYGANAVTSNATSKLTETRVDG